MAKYPETTTTAESVLENGDHLLEVQFLAPKSRSSSIRTVDPKFGKKYFRVTAGAVKALHEVNDRLNEALTSLSRAIGQMRPERKRAEPMDAGMAVFLYTRRVEPRMLPEVEILLDEFTVRTLLKKSLKGYF